MITTDEQRALWRDGRMTTAEVLAVVLDPWWGTVPRADRLAWWARRHHQELAHTVGFATWGAFLAAQEEGARTKVALGQPPAEVSTRDPRPADAPPDPSALVKLAAAADAGWEIRIGYARGWKKLGRGNVGTSADARWAPHHFVSLQARPVGSGGRACLWITYAAEAVEGKLAWKFDRGQAWGDPGANVTKVRAALTSAPPEELMERVATLPETRLAVAPTTDIFVAC